MLARLVGRAGGGFVGVVRKLKTLRSLGRDRRRLLREAVLTLAYARLWLATTPFRKAARRLGRVTPVTEPELAEESDAAAILQARDIGWAIRLAAPRMPFKAVCLQQAVAGKLMLRRRGIASVIHFGVARPTAQEEMKAHAWLDAGPVRLTGYPVPPEFAEVARFR